MRLACFVTPHGFGHAARTASVLAALRRRTPDLAVEFFTQVSPWFFRESGIPEFGYHEELVDIGFAQTDAFNEDCATTLARLGSFLPFDPARVKRLAAKVLALGCHAVICDIAPLGIAVAGEAGLPSVLIENFTWDWIYSAYGPEFGPYCEILRGVFERVDLRIRTPPSCDATHGSDVGSPVGREPRQPSGPVREALGVPPDMVLLLVTFGGFGGDLATPPARAIPGGVVAVIPGAADRVRRVGNCILLPHHSGFYHPDLVAASDILIGKLGYSTVAEAWMSDPVYGFVRRRQFPESQVLEAFVQREMRAAPIEQAELDDGSWPAGIPALLALRARRPRLPLRPGGATGIADRLFSFFSS